MSMGVELGDIEQLVGSAYRLRTVNYMNVVSFALLVYDYSLVFSSEVELIWKSKWNIVKVLYLLSRYPAFSDSSLAVYKGLGSVPMKDCWALDAAGTWVVILGIAVAEAILILRTAALWGNSKKIIWSLSLLLAVTFILCVVFAFMFLDSQTAAPPPFPSITGCNLVGGNPIVLLNFVFLIMFETAIVVLTTYRWFKKFRGSISPLVATLYRDGIIFFVCLSLLSLGNALVVSLGPVEYQALITPLQRAMHSVLSCRIILNVREADQRSKMSHSSLSKLNQSYINAV